MAAKLTANYGGGYCYNFVDENLNKFMCNLCNKVFRDPHLTGCCGQVFCESCIHYWNFNKAKAIKHHKMSCPHCHTEGKKFQYMVDIRVKLEIDSLRIHCTNKEEGCQWIGELGSLKDHLQSPSGCDYVGVACPNKCKLTSSGGGLAVIIIVKRKDLSDHLKKDCYNRPYQCEHCGHKDTYRNITGSVPDEYGLPTLAHYWVCPEFPLMCPNKCGEKEIRRKDMRNHRSQCPEEPVQCPFEEAGCKEKILRHELEQHMLDTQQQHLLKVLRAYKEMKRENTVLRKKLALYEEKL